MKSLPSLHRLVTYSWFALLAIAGLVLEKQWHEMHVSKLLLFAAISVWARELSGSSRWVLLGMVGLLWLMVLTSWWLWGSL